MKLMKPISKWKGHNIPDIDRRNPKFLTDKRIPTFRVVTDSIKLRSLRNTVLVDSENNSFSCTEEFNQLPVQVKILYCCETHH